MPSNSQDLLGDGGVLYHELLEEEGRDADHREAPSVDLGVVQPLDVGARALAQAQGIETQVTRDTAPLVLHAQDVAVRLAFLQVVLRQRLDADADQQHRGLHLVQAECTVQRVQCACGAQLLRQGAAVRRLGEDCQEGTHREAAVLHLGLPVIVIGGLWHGRGCCVEDAGAQGQIERVEAEVRRFQPRVLVVLVGRGLLRHWGVAAEEVAPGGDWLSALAGRTQRQGHSASGCTQRCDLPVLGRCC
mmetsp:Transcript_7585/g.21219  ORF Transcript_7585/g.21219 Transcript_7585/m.21219 type:complete len:246 (+) Transcript_7585:214-951(+)